MKLASLPSQCLVLLLCSACGGASSSGVNDATGADGRGAERTAPDDHAVTKVVIAPTEAERASGGQVVNILAPEAVVHWTESEAFSTTGWVPHVEDSVARYRVSFEESNGTEVLAFFIGTTNDSPVEYKCYGLCATWWVAPTLPNGSVDLQRYRVMSDEVWHPLAREWYLAH